MTTRPRRDTKAERSRPFPTVCRGDCGSSPQWRPARAALRRRNGQDRFLQSV